MDPRTCPRASTLHFLLRVTDREDIRSCRVYDLEVKRINKEMAHIRQKFKEGNLDGYQKKKWALCIIHLTGVENLMIWKQVDIGHMEAVNLISSRKYSEKQIGYLALTLLLHEHSEIIMLVVNSIRKDLEDLNEVFNCLALHAIANIGGKEMAEALVLDVHRCLISRSSNNFVKKKAALTLLRLYRKHPDIIPISDFAQRLCTMIDDVDLGVALSVTSLVMTLAQDHPDEFVDCYDRAVTRLAGLVIHKEYQIDYIYYRVPIPWLQVKLLRLLQYYPPSQNSDISQELHKVLQAILKISQMTPSNIQHNNAQNAVLFEAINLAIHLDAESSMVTASAELLGKFITSKETNVRYLGLDTMAHLAACSMDLEAIQKHQDTIILSLKDKDISVRRRALDLMYSMCDGRNSQIIVGELLKFLSVADYGLREEMVLKIAILTEKFATEYKWYLDTILELIAIAGDHVGDEVWYRVIQIVMNFESLQEYAAQIVFQNLRNPSCHENMIKVAAYVLGEFGHLIANNVGPATRAILLSTYLKWTNIFPEIKDIIISVFERYRHVLDAELQQRACEYLVIALRQDDEALLQIVCEEMPPFPEKESALISRLYRKQGDTEDKRVWVIGGHEANKDRRAQAHAKKYNDKVQIPPSAVDIQTHVASDSSQANDEPLRDVSVPFRSTQSDIMASLMGLDISNPSQLISSPKEAILTSVYPPLLQSDDSAPSTPTQKTSSILPGNSPNKAPPISFINFTTSPHIESDYETLCFSSAGQLFRNEEISITMKSEYHGSQGILALTVQNNSSMPLTEFNIAVECVELGSLDIRLKDTLEDLLAIGANCVQTIHLECRKIYSQPPALKVSYKAEQFVSVALKLPVVLSCFIQPIALDQASFFERWNKIGGQPRESQSIFKILLLADGNVNVEWNSSIVEGHRLGLLQNIDPNPLNIVAAGILQTAEGKTGCLVRLEPNKESKLCRITVRTTDELASSTLQHLLKSSVSQFKGQFV